jgi:hypothetical protein
MTRIIFCAALLGCVACGGSQDGVMSDVATSTVSGALNNTSGTKVGWKSPSKPIYRQFIESLNPIRTARAASWMCSGGTLSPSFDGAARNPYTYTPLSCSVEWGNDKQASSEWTGTFVLNYGASCDSTHPYVGNQTGNCAVTRTTSEGGATRTLTGPDGNTYAITHDTNGAGTGWDTSVSPAPSNGGVVATCAANGCDEGGTLVINGSHLTGTVTSGGTATKIWDHTVSTGQDGLTVTVKGTTRTVSGSLTVQHNLAKYDATVTFNNASFGDGACCFPTSGSVTTTFLSGTDKGRTESLSFSPICGEATLTTASGATRSYTLMHCL